MESAVNIFTRSRFTSLLGARTFLASGLQTPKKVLFDHTRHEEAGTSAQWVICTASEPNPTPAIPTAETSWNGGISAWGFDLFKAGYAVQSLPPTGRVTYGDATNAQDLSNYQVYIIPEPYLKFSATEKQAILFPTSRMAADSSSLETILAPPATAAREAPTPTRSSTIW